MGQQPPKVGEDVTTLMGGTPAPPVGADVSHLMGGTIQTRTPAAPVAAGGRGTGLDVRKSADFASGIRAGAESTVYHGGDLLRRATGMDRIIDKPEVQAAITPPASPQGQAGFMTERGAEFLAPVARVAKLTEALPWFGRTMAEAGTGATVAGVQTGGDPAAMITTAGMSAAIPVVSSGVKAGVSAAREAAAGAAEGGFTGAVASAVRATTPGETRAMLTQALKPRNAAVNWGRSVERALPDLKAAEASLGKPIETIEDLQAVLRTAKANNRAQYNAVAGPLRDQGTTVDLTPVADKVVETIPRKVQLTNPDQAEAIAKGAAVYRKRYSLQDAEALLQDTNAELEAFYAQFPGAQRAALRARPEVARMVAEADALRTAIYATLDKGGETGAARELQRGYGALLDIESEAARRANVAARQQPESLSEQIGKVRAAGEYAKGAWRLSHGDLAGAADIASAKAQRGMASYLKEQQTTNMLIKRAFAGYRGTPIPAHAPAVAVATPAVTARSVGR